MNLTPGTGAAQVAPGISSGQDSRHKSRPQHLRPASMFQNGSAPSVAGIAERGKLIIGQGQAGRTGEAFDLFNRGG